MVNTGVTVHFFQSFDEKARPPPSRTRNYREAVGDHLLWQTQLRDTRKRERLPYNRHRMSIEWDLFTSCLSSLRQLVLKVLGRERTFRGDQFARRIHLTPDVPEQHASNLLFFLVINHTFAIRLFPINYRA